MDTTQDTGNIGTVSVAGEEHERDALIRIHVAVPAGMVGAIEAAAKERGMRSAVLCRRLIAEGIGYTLPATMITGKKARRHVDEATGQLVRAERKKTRRVAARERLDALLADGSLTPEVRDTLAALGLGSKAATS